MSSQVKLNIARKQVYDISIQNNLHQAIAEHLAPYKSTSRLFFITHPSIDHYYGQTIKDQLERAKFETHFLYVPEGENSKSLEFFDELCTKLLAKNIERKDVIIALGGGVIGDLAGFVASACLRGVNFIQMPTTLLAQVDASIGGKTGINHAAGKNLIGAFYQPKRVLVDPMFLKSLEPRQLRSGLAEVLKYGVIWDEQLFTYLDTHSHALAELSVTKYPDHWQHIIQRSCEIKAHIVQEDETEQGLRAILNYGHTIGHGIEAALGYGTYLHGEAIALGMKAANDIAVHNNLLSTADANKVTDLLSKLGFDLRLKESKVDEILSYMKNDKKRQAAAHRFILATKIGQVQMQTVTDEREIKAAIKRLMEKT
ncbi:MAG: 3-dehydroquinate synthase [bacterium]